MWKDRKPGDPCVKFSGECWDCIETYRQMTLRSATGATLHGLNNSLLAMRLSCSAGDKEGYTKALKHFLKLLKEGGK